MLAEISHMALPRHLAPLPSIAHFVSNVNRKPCLRNLSSLSQAAETAKIACRGTPLIRHCALTVPLRVLSDLTHQRVRDLYSWCFFAGD